VSEIIIDGHFLDDPFTSRSFTDDILSFPIFASNLTSGDIAEEIVSLGEMGYSPVPLYSYSNTSLFLRIELKEGYHLGSLTYPTVSSVEENGSRLVAEFDLTSAVAIHTYSQGFGRGLQVQVDAFTPVAQEWKDLFVRFADFVLGAVMGVIVSKIGITRRKTERNFVQRTIENLT